ncbi:MAG: hypothetical protein FWC33_04170 [Candidatus Bathyarchaeota archaeon]|nr:hypothetical protein [Candidatus Termiticorpusculum sp.]
MQSKNDDTSIKRMADLLRQGATLTDLSCPACSAPLFRFKDNTLWCEQDQKKVIIVKDTQIPTAQIAPQTNRAYDKLENTLLTKIQTLEDKIEKTEDLEEIQKLSTALSELLNSLEKIRKIKTNT